MLRLFVALALPNQIRDQIAPIQSGLPDARWVRQENLHLTIRFIGEVENSLAEEMHFALSKLSFETFSFRLQGIDTFRSRKSVRSIWIGIEPSASLKALNRKIETILIGLGLAPQTRKFTPHVTLARFKQTPIKRVLPYLVGNAGFQTSLFEVCQVFLFRSHLGGQGANYEALATYPDIS